MLTSLQAFTHKRHFWIISSFPSISIFKRLLKMLNSSLSFYKKCPLIFLNIGLSIGISDISKAIYSKISSPSSKFSLEFSMNFIISSIKLCQLFAISKMPMALVAEHNNFFEIFVSILLLLFKISTKINVFISSFWI